MQTPYKFKLAIPLQPTSAANQDYLDEHAPVVTAANGWDPFEVWQRMIKQPRDRRLASNTV